LSAAPVVEPAALLDVVLDEGVVIRSHGADGNGAAERAPCEPDA